jgi:hypothetical protein
MRQFKALQRISNDVKLNKSDRLVFKFEIEDTKSVDSIELEISLEMIICHIVEANIPFLLSLVDLDRLKVYFNNLTNELIQDSSTDILQIGMKNGRCQAQIDMKNDRYSMIRRYEHAFLLWKIPIHTLIVDFLAENPCFLTEVELRRLHRRFDHLSTRRLYQILDRAGYDHEIEFSVIDHLIKYCHHCQMHEKFSSRFSFIIRDEDIQFNYNILIDILYIDSKSMLHIVDEATRFQTGR